MCFLEFNKYLWIRNENGQWYSDQKQDTLTIFFTKSFLVPTFANAAPDQKLFTATDALLKVLFSMQIQKDIKYFVHQP